MEKFAILGERVFKFSLKAEIGGNAMSNPSSSEIFVLRVVKLLLLFYLPPCNLVRGQDVADEGLVPYNFQHIKS